MLKSIVLSFLGICIVLSCTPQHADQSVSEISIVPKPVELRTSTGFLDIKNGFNIIIESPTKISDVMPGLLHGIEKAKGIESSLNYQ